ncbi:MAG: hypothetical protein KBD56_05255 [Candidatus Eisenbacteria bacterium]|nr:hypothetical protein [Candidatus Eisenbacteria bacterium]
MDRMHLLWWGLAASLAFLFLAPVASGETYLEATFDDKAIDQPIGVGGPAVGEPVYIDSELQAIVRSSPFGTPCLEIHNTDPAQHRWIGFEMEEAVSTGLVVVIMDVWFYRIGWGDEFWLYLYDDIWSNNFLALVFDGTGGIWGSTKGGSVGELGSFSVGRPYPIMIVLDMDAETLSIWLDGVPALVDYPHGADAAARMQQVQWAGRVNAAPDSRMSIDQIRVISDLVPAPAESMTWGRIRALYR